MNRSYRSASALQLLLCEQCFELGDGFELFRAAGGAFGFDQVRELEHANGTTEVSRHAALPQPA